MEVLKSCVFRIKNSELLAAALSKELLTLTEETQHLSDMHFMKETGDLREALFIFLAEVTNKHEKHYRGKATGVDEIP